MNRQHAGLCLVALMIASGSAALYWGSGFRGDRQTSGRALYLARCAACHGVNLEGQKDWKNRLPNGRMPAPPHDASGHTWHHGDKVLFGITKFGLKPYVGDAYESDMPAFEGVLSDEEIVSILDYIKGTWPDEAREWQENVARNEK